MQRMESLSRLCLRFIFRLTKLLVALAALLPGAFAILPADDSGASLKIISSTNEPVRLIRIHPVKPGQSDLLIEIENLTAKPIRFVSYRLAPADCPRSDHPAAVGIGYGDWSAAFPHLRKYIESPIPGYGKKGIRFPRSLYKELLQYQKSHGCLSHQRPELMLDKVAFCDGTGWEGFAGGPHHSEWNGRDWTPSGLSNCSESR